MLDEADRLLNMDFEAEIDQILRVIPRERRTQLFSATMTSKVGRLLALLMKSVQAWAMVCIMLVNVSDQDQRQGVDVDKQFILSASIAPSGAMSTCSAWETTKQALVWGRVPVLLLLCSVHAMRRRC